MDNHLDELRTAKVRREKLAAMNGNAGVPATPAAISAKAAKKAAAKAAKAAAAEASGTPALPATPSAADEAARKKKMACNKFQLGSCTKTSADCTYGHFKDPDALARARSQSPTGSTKGKGRGRGADRGRSRERGGSSARSDSVPRTDADRKLIQCRYEAKGSCRAGANCKFLHALVGAVCMLVPSDGFMHAASLATSPSELMSSFGVFALPAQKAQKATQFADLSTTEVAFVYRDEDNWWPIGPVIRKPG